MVKPIICTLFRAGIRGLFRAEIRALFRAEIRALFRVEISVFAHIRQCSALVLPE